MARSLPLEIGDDKGRDVQPSPVVALPSPVFPPSALLDDDWFADLEAALAVPHLIEMLDLLERELLIAPGALADALHQGDVDLLRRLAHSLKGATSSAGAQAAAAIARRIEDADSAALKPLVSELGVIAADTIRAIAVKRRLLRDQMFASASGTG